MDGQRSHLQLDIYKKGVKNSNTSHRLPIGSEKKKQFPIIIKIIVLKDGKEVEIFNNSALKNVPVN